MNAGSGWGAAASIVPERGMAVFVGADSQHAEQLRRVALTAVPKTTELWFTSLERLLELKTARRRDGRTRTGRGGATLEVETPIPPDDFFARELLLSLDGKRGRLVV
jgi:hypothetical protein